MTPGPGLLLLSGGQSRRMGQAKHALAHPSGGSWGAHLVRVFHAVFPGAPVQVLGEPLPDRLDLQVIGDPREGPARALRIWASLPVPPASRWWVVACDQVRWSPGTLEAWMRRAEVEDPQAARWVVAQHGGRLQPLGGWLPEALRSAVAAAAPRSLTGLVQSLPHLVLPCDGDEWRDVDTPEERRAFEGEGPESA